MTVATIRNQIGEELANLTALLTHLSNVVEEQLEVAEKGKLVSLHLNQKLFTLLIRHKGILESESRKYAGDFEVSSKELFTSFLGKAAGMYNRMRDYPESRAMRDNYTALSLLAATLTSLKTYGLMVGDKNVSKMAYDMLEEVCPLIVEFSHGMVEVVAREAAQREGLAYKPEVVERVTNAVKRCWS